MTLKRNLPYWLLVILAAGWLGTTLLAPYARAQSWPVAPWLYALYAPVCHQIPERSFACWNHPLAVCHRCTGLYAGFVMGLLVLPSLDRFRRWLLSRPRVILLFFVPMAVDVFLIPNTSATRFATGFAAAFPVALLAWAAASQIYDSWTRPSRPFSDSCPTDPHSSVPTQPAMEET